ncbi:glycosyltransferase family 4 protein [Azohydromonas aeria]|uniref:glycosyltransferase family 4 protein n=1 Tax=Azohydromonas aeria TaxID=2590212 RepID=UPI0012F8DFDD|nr:glycosyltransferase family 4 protein [Azohydromonas aeria]
MRILLVNKLYAPDVAGGAEITLANLAAGMLARGHTVRVATTTAASEASTEVVDGVEVTRLPLRNLYWHHDGVRRGPLQRLLWHARDRRNRAMGQALGRVIDDFRPDAVAFHNLAGFSAAAWEAAFARGVPTVQVLHDYYHLCPRSQLFRDGRNCKVPCNSCGVLRQGRSGASSRIDAVIGVSRAVLDAHLRQGVFAQVPVQRVVHNAWPLAGPAPGAAPGHGLTFGYIGALAEWKGVGRLLEAFARVARETGSPPMRLLLAGEGERGYEAALRARHAGADVEFLGRVPAADFYRRVDVCVVPSLWHDPLPSVVFEALLSGVPVLASRRGGIPEMVSHGGNGLLFDPDTEGALETGLRAFAAEPGGLAAWKQRARASAVPFGDMARVVAAHVEVCEAAAAERRA